MHERDTEFATQLARSAADYLGAPPDIGRAVGQGLRELFVACEPAVALVQQFEHAPQRFIALHDAGCQAARHLLEAIAAACGAAVQRLTIRRTGYGTVLAALAYVDCPTDDGIVRLYCTDVDADSATRQELARALMDHAVLTVVMVGEQPAHVLERLLGELAASLQAAAFCRDVLLLSLGPPHLLKAPAQAFANATTRTVRLSPRVATPADAWAPLRAAWNGLQATRGEGTGPLLPALAMTPAASTPAPATVAPVPPPAARSLQDVAQALAALPGVMAACVFDVATSRVLAHAGEPAAAAPELARRGTLLLAAGSASRRQLAHSGPALDVVVHGAAQASAVHVLAAQPGRALHLVYDPARTDWATLRDQLV